MNLDSLTMFEAMRTEARYRAQLEEKKHAREAHKRRATSQDRQGAAKQATTPVTARMHLRTALGSLLINIGQRLAYHAT